MLLYTKYCVNRIFPTIRKLTSIPLDLYFFFGVDGSSLTSLQLLTRNDELLISVFGSDASSDEENKLRAVIKLTTANKATRRNFKLILIDI